MAKAIQMFATVGMLGLVGCASDAPTGRPDISNLNQGLNLLDVEPAIGVVGAYVKGDRVVYVETRVGDLKPAIYRYDAPEEPAFEMDLRFVDKDGVTFFAQRGGDLWIDPTWEADLVAAEEIVPDMAERDADFRLAQEAGLAMGVEMTGDLAIHAFHAADMIQQEVPSEAIRRARVQDSVAYGSWGSVKSAQGYYKCVSLCVGEHSAPRLLNSTGGVIVNLCNHGTCAAASGMSYYGTCSGGGGKTIGGDGTSVGTGSHTGACTTAYHWSSKSGYHLCNDDTLFQFAQTQGKTTAVSSTTWAGSDGYDNYSCNGASCGGHWAYPVCAL